MRDPLSGRSLNLASPHHKIAPLFPSLTISLPPSLFRPQFAKGVDQAEVMKALSQLGGNAGLIGALQSKLDGLVGLSSGFVESLHYQVRARVDALRNIQQSHDELREKFLEEKRALEEKYRGLYAPLYAERASIVKGEVDVDAGAPGEGEVADESEEMPKGIPDFWLCALRNHEAIAEQITEKDEEALKYLVDVTCKPLEPVAPEEPEEEEEEEARGFTIDFHFEQPNPFFTNAVLSKSYHMVDEEDPILEFSEGTEIDWLPGKNLCVKVLRKKPKKGVKNAKPITKTERCESFFNFFSPPEIPEDDADLNAEEVEQLQDAMEMDYEIGALIKEKIIPDAVSWFTGEANEGDDSEGDSDYDDEEDSEDDEDESVDEEDDDDSDEDDETPAEGKKGKAKGDDGEKPPECKQQ